MREDMRDAAGDAASRRERALPSASVAPSRRAVQPVVGTSVMPPSRPLVGALAQQDRAVAAHRDEGRAAPQRLVASSAPCSGKRSGSPSRKRARNRRAAGRACRRPLRRADRGAEIHHRLREIAGPRRPAPASRRAARISAWRRAAASRSRTRRDIDPLDIAVDHRRRPVEGDRRDRRRRIGADAGQRAQAVARVGKAAAMVARRPRRRIS